MFYRLYPTEADEYEGLRVALGKLKLNDAALSYEPESSQVRAGRFAFSEYSCSSLLDVVRSYLMLFSEPAANIEGACLPGRPLEAEKIFLVLCFCLTATRESRRREKPSLFGSNWVFERGSQPYCGFVSSGLKRSAFPAQREPVCRTDRG